MFLQLGYQQLLAGGIFLCIPWSDLGEFYLLWLWLGVADMATHMWVKLPHFGSLGPQFRIGKLFQVIKSLFAFIFLYYFEQELTLKRRFVWLHNFFSIFVLHSVDKIPTRHSKITSKNHLRTCDTVWYFYCTKWPPAHLSIIIWGLQ